MNDTCHAALSFKRMALDHSAERMEITDDVALCALRSAHEGHHIAYRDGKPYAFPRWQGD